MYQVTFPFRRLPFELQLLVYKHAFAKDDSINVCSRLRSLYRERYQEYIRGGASRLRKPDWGGMDMHRQGFGLRTKIDRIRHQCAYRGCFHPNPRYIEKDEPRQMPLALLYTSTTDARLATEAFYGINTFRFPHSHGWAAFECFLNTIGPNNSRHLRSLEVHAPLWQDGMNLDNLQIAWIEASHEQTGLTPIKTPPRDRYLGALRTSCLLLGKLGCLQRLSLILPSDSVHKWIMDDDEAMERMLKDKRDRYLKRKAEEIQIFERLSAALPKLKITLLIQPSTCTEEEEAFNDLERIEGKARAHGWNVDIAPVRKIPHENRSRR